MPTHARKGEQIGVRIALFNYWHVDQEVSIFRQSYVEYVVPLELEGAKLQGDNVNCLRHYE